MKLQQVKSFLWQWGWLILLGTAVAASTAYLTSQTIPPTYEATAVWLVDEPAKSDTAAANESSAAQTYAALVRTRPVLAETIDRLDLPFAEEQLGRMVTAVAPANTAIINIRIEGTDPGRAALIANTMGEVLADQTAARESERFAAPIANWQQQIDDSSAAIAGLQSQLTADDVTNRPQLESNLAETQARYDDAFAQLNDLLTQQAAETTIITPAESARASTMPIRPRTAVATLGAALAGALAALAAALLVGRANSEEEGMGTAVTQSPQSAD